ncbi:L-glutamate gamma-semialdehyde dehydrogenase [bacterium]|mgnify:FL=1|jgi:1-pyrroline-5-carboxylate dehydrogenase|nr:L-glutamate gamma-semialdehyde dehydrogenase [bacterium]
MSKGVFNVPIARNEAVKSYIKGSSEREELLSTYMEMYNSSVEIPLYVGGKEIFTDNKKDISPPHDHKHKIGKFNLADKSHIEMAIESALAAKENWSNLPWNHRVAIFLKAAELLAGPYRSKINAATMIAQSKNVYQAEIDAACELIDFFKFNAQYVTKLYSEQPESSEGIWNRLEHRPLEGFVFAITPFNFTSICANLCAAPALMGNVVIWKPAATQVYSAKIIMDLFKEAGLPDGVINMVPSNGAEIGEVVFKHRAFAGLHFTGSTNVFRNLWQTIGKNISNYRSYPRIVGETGGKDFIVAHKSANPKQVATGISRGAFEYQGQKCSAASRAYLPSNLWKEIKEQIVKDVNSFKMGSPENPSNFINAVISEKAFDSIANYIDFAKNEKDADVLVGGNYDKSKGYFIEPTIIITTNPNFKTMHEEIFGPVLTIYVYNEKNWLETLKIIDETSDYALTGAVFSTDRYAIDEATKALENAAGNFYINDKPTGAVVGQQPFGGSRGSGTNDKAGSVLNLLRWVSPRTIKETFNPANDYRYPFLEE